jgi:hypothetical protein
VLGRNNPDWRGGRAVLKQCTFSIMFLLLWGICYTAQSHHLPSPDSSPSIRRTEAQRRTPRATPKDNWAAFWSAFRTAITKRDRVALKEMMAPRFKFCTDFDLLPEEALRRLDRNDAWDEFDKILFSLTPVLSQNKELYKPNPHDYPQIIQAHDYATIKSIESLFTALSNITSKDTLEGDVADNTITFRSTTTRNTVTIRTHEDNVTINRAKFSSGPTLALYTTAIRVLTDLSKGSKCKAVMFSQFRTRAYKRRTVIEFNFGPRVVVLDSFSNGPQDDERLYTLDLVDESNSFFWGKSK